MSTSNLSTEKTRLICKHATQVTCRQKNKLHVIICFSHVKLEMLNVNINKLFLKINIDKLQVKTSISRVNKNKLQVDVN